MSVYAEIHPNDCVHVTGTRRCVDVKLRHDRMHVTPTRHCVDVKYCHDRVPITPKCHSVDVKHRHDRVLVRTCTLINILIDEHMTKLKARNNFHAVHDKVESKEQLSCRAHGSSTLYIYYSGGEGGGSCTTSSRMDP